MVGRTGSITSSRVAEAVSLATGHIRRWSTSAQCCNSQGTVFFLTSEVFSFSPMHCNHGYTDKEVDYSQCAALTYKRALTVASFLKKIWVPFEI
jgi:hypothetical protein